VTEPLPRSFYERDVHDVAPDLLGKVLVGLDGTAARIVEVEAYGGVEDPGSHAARGPTPRNASMFGPPGHLYVYLIYGMHWCANVVCGAEGDPMAVLLRAAAPERGLATMRARRPACRRDADLCRGPGRLCRALGLEGRHDGHRLVGARRGPRLLDDGAPAPGPPVRSTRIGLRHGADLPWRWCAPDRHHLSRQP
jgi:DNA-3-methyladenine glycosylase